MLKTETPSTQHPELDRYPVDVLVDALIDDQTHAVRAVQAAAPAIGAAVEAMTPRIAGGGRLIYVGAGTSGRLGILDSVELFPTFSWPHRVRLVVDQRIDQQVHRVPVQFGVLRTRRLGFQHK